MKKIESWETSDGQVFKGKNEAWIHEQRMIGEAKLSAIMTEIGWSDMCQEEVASLIWSERKRFWEILNDAR